MISFNNMVNKEIIMSANHNLNSLPDQKKEASQFYKNLFTLVGPTAIQNLLSAAISSADVIMLNFVGQSAIAAVNLASYIQFVLFIILTGLSSGMIMLTAQYWGKKDTFSIETIFGFAVKIAIISGILFGLAAFFFPSTLMKIFTNEEKLISIGADYLKIVSISFICLSISNVCQSIIKSIERVKTVTFITINAIFCFIKVPRIPLGSSEHTFSKIASYPSSSRICFNLIENSSVGSS